MDDSLAVPLPASGRTFSTARRVGLDAVSPRGRCRLDGLARLVQDVADEDVSDAGLPTDLGWVVRRTELLVGRFPSFRSELELTTWASGTGRSWAERRTSVSGADGSSVEVAALWVQLDLSSGRPATLDERFRAAYARAAGGRRVRARLRHRAAPAAQTGWPWPLRFCDFDVMGHVNNAAMWEPVEEHLAARADLRPDRGVRVSVEHPAAAERGAELRVPVEDGPDGFRLWLVDRGTTVASAELKVFQACGSRSR